MKYFLLLMVCCCLVGCGSEATVSAPAETTARPADLQVSGTGGGGGGETSSGEVTEAAPLID
jgi:uncharacterized protein YceK